MLTSGAEAAREYERIRSYRERLAIGPHDDARHPHMNSLHDPWQDSNFTPAQLPGLKFWIRADQKTLNSGNVSQITDLSGNGVNFTQGTAGSQPLWNASDAAGGGQPSIQVLTGKSIANAGFSLAQPLSMLVVGYVSTDSTEIVGGATSRVDIGRNSGGFYIYAGSVPISSPSRDGNAHAFCYLANNTAFQPLYVDSSAAPAVTGNAGTNALTGPTISVFPPSSTPSATFEWIVCAGTLTVMSIAQTFRYFGARYAHSAWG